MVGGPWQGRGSCQSLKPEILTAIRGRESRPKVDELESRYSPKVHTCVPVHAHVHTHSEDTV